MIYFAADTDDDRRQRRRRCRRRSIRHFISAAISRRNVMAALMNKFEWLKNWSRTTLSLTLE